MNVAYYKSPTGTLQLFANTDALTSIQFVENKAFPESPNRIIEFSITELDEYFSGKRYAFDIPLDVQGTDFYRHILNEVSNIKYGETVSYKELAQRAGYPGAYRAVGTVMRKNRFHVIIPCHRVAGSGGKPGGYSAGMDIKEWLLEHEKKVLDRL